eukprot:16942-Heterococcus_DN1.PRE.2
MNLLPAMSKTAASSTHRAPLILQPDRRSDSSSDPKKAPLITGLSNLDRSRSILTGNITSNGCPGACKSKQLK